MTNAKSFTIKVANLESDGKTATVYYKYNVSDGWTFEINDVGHVKVWRTRHGLTVSYKLFAHFEDLEVEYYA